MSLVKQQIHALTGGISQQPPPLRQRGQLEEVENCFPSVVNGLIKRQPTEHLAEMVSGSISGEVLVHTIDRSATERYVALIYEDNVKVFDAADGSSVPVHGPSSPYTADFSYLAKRASNPVTDPETFDDSADWSLTGSASSAASTSEADPLGFGTTAVLLEGAGVGSAWSQDVGTFAQKTVFSVYLKRPDTNPLSSFLLELFDSTGTAAQYNATFAVAGDGEITLTNASSGTATTTAGLTDVGGGWFRCYVALDADNGANTSLGDDRQIRITSLSGGTAGIYAWGAHVSEGVDTPLPYGGEVGSLRALTVADFTFVVNGDRVVESGTNAANTLDGDEALIFVTQGGIQDCKYTVDVELSNATTGSAEFETPTTVTGLQSDEDIAEDLRTDLDAISGVTATREGSVIRIVTGTGVTFSQITTGDSRGNSLIRHVHNEVDLFTNLPAVAPDGFQVKVVGRPDGDPVEGWYVKFQADKAGEFGGGQWVETLDRGIVENFNAGTMPHQLVRKQDDSMGTVTGTADQIYFEWGQVDWADRTVGDDTSNPLPSFVSQGGAQNTITDVFFFQGRLGFLSDQNVIMSEVNQFFNFWRTTTRSLPDSEVIDVQASHTRVSLLNHAVPFNDQLILFSDRTQFLLTGTPVLSPSSITITPVLEFENFVSAKPVPTGRSIFFGYPRGDFSGVREMFQESEVSFDTDDIAQQVPQLIQGDVLEMAASTLEDMVAIRSETDRSRLYVYKYHWNGRERSQSSWVEYTFGGGDVIAGISWIENTLYMVVNRPGGFYLEKMVVSQSQTDEDADYVTYLDRRLKDTDTGVSSSYDSAANETTFTVPFTLRSTEEYSVVRRNTSTVNGGLVYSIVSRDNAQGELVVSGDLTSTPVWIGQVFTAKFTFSRPEIKFPTERGEGTLISGREQVLYGRLNHENTSDYEVVVKPRQGDNTTSRFTSKIIGNAATVLGQLALSDGSHRYAIFRRAEEVDVTVQSASPLPMNIISAEFEYNFRSPGGRL